MRMNTLKNSSFVIDIVENFANPGSILAKDGGTVKEIDNRVRKATCDVQELSE